MAFTDLHVHPGLKTQFSDRSNPLTPCDIILPDILPIAHRMCSDFPAVLQSQSNVAQLHQHDVRLVCTALYAPEPALFQDSSQLLIKLGRKPRMRRTLNPDRLSEFTAPTYAPFPTLLQEVDTLLAPCGSGNQQLRPLQRQADFSDTSANVFSVFSVEGCHSLVNSLNDFNNLTTLPDVIIGNLNQLRQRVPVLAVNLTHMQQFSLCNHAFGLQFLEHPAFFPGNSGLSETGFTLAQRCLDSGVLIDIKHMSLLARQQFYARQSSAGFPHPIICTHAGFTGIPMGQFRDFVSKQRLLIPKVNSRLLHVAKPQKYLNETAFNATSINLFDEDLLAIMRSGGILGLSMDQRILGYNPVSLEDDAHDAFIWDIDFLAQPELAVLGDLHTRGSRQNHREAMQNHHISRESQVVGSPNNRFLHFKYLVNHLIHLMVVARDNGFDPLQALEHVCLGSDFDGMINPLTMAPTIGSYARIRERFVDHFADLVEEANVGLHVPSDQVETIAEGIFYRNGRNFILNRLP